MSNALVSIGDMEKMALAMAKSKLFGVKTPDEALSLMLISQAEGRHPALAARDYDIIQNKPAKKTEAMMRDFIDNGGKVEWHKLDNEVADATFSHPSGGTVRIDWTMARAKDAGLGGKDMWRKYPRQMLRSRCVSEGIRTVCPAATSGMYVPEEIQDFVKEKDITPLAGAGDDLSEEQKARMIDLAAKINEWIAQGSIEDAFAEVENAAPEVSEYNMLWKQLDSRVRRQLKDEGERRRIKAQSKVVPTDTISDAQRKRLEALINERGLDRDEVKAFCLKNYGVAHFTELSKEDYADLDNQLLEPAPPQNPASVSHGAENSSVVSSVAGAAPVYGLLKEAYKNASIQVKARFDMKAKDYSSIDEIPLEKADAVYSWLKKQIDSEAL